LHLLAIRFQQARQQRLGPATQQFREGLIADIGHVLLFEQAADNLQGLLEAPPQFGEIAPRPEQRGEREQARRPFAVGAKFDGLEAMDWRQPLEHLVQIGGVRARRCLPRGVLMRHARFLSGEEGRILSVRG
jgi:hypothetical protein